MPDRGPAPDAKDPPSRATALRLSQYLRTLGARARAGGTVSSDELAQSVRVSAAQVRRDLAALGHLGQRGVGYDAAGLAAAIRHALGIDRPWRAVLVGVGNLARALLKYPAFRDQRFAIVALFDSDPRKVGEVVEGLTVEPAADLPRRLPQLRAELAVLTVPSGAAQSLADVLAGAGVRGIMNFAPVNLRLPAGVQVVAVDLAMQLEQLAFLVQLAATADKLSPATPPEGGLKQANDSLG